MNKDKSQIKQTIWTQIFGIPIYTEDYDGEIRKRRGRPLPDGEIVFSKIYGKVIGNPDGSVQGSYVKKWFLR